MIMTRKSPVTNLFLFPEEEQALRQYSKDNRQSLMSMVRNAVLEKLERSGYNLRKQSKNGGSVAAEPKTVGVSNERGHTKR